MGVFSGWGTFLIFRAYGLIFTYFVFFFSGNAFCVFKHTNHSFLWIYLAKVNLAVIKMTPCKDYIGKRFIKLFKWSGHSCHFFLWSTNDPFLYSSLNGLKQFTAVLLSSWIIITKNFLHIFYSLMIRSFNQIYLS